MAKPGVPHQAKQTWIKSLIHGHNKNPLWITRFLQRHHHWLCLALLVFIGTVHQVAPDRAAPFSTLGHFNEETGLYANGMHDIAYVFTWAIVWTLLRWASHTFFLVPIASLLGLQRSDNEAICDQQKFADQGWVAIYYTLAFVSGIYVQSVHSWGFSVDKMWEDFPQSQHTFVLKV